MSESSWSDGVTHYTTDSNSTTNIIGRVSYITIGAWIDAVAGMNNKVVLGFDIDIRIGAKTDLTIGGNLINHPGLGKYVRQLDDLFHGITGWTYQKARECYCGTVDRIDVLNLKIKNNRIAEFNSNFRYGSQTETCKSLYRVTSPYILLNGKNGFIIESKIVQANGKLIKFT
jgi:hypothetical protein